MLGPVGAGAGSGGDGLEDVEFEFEGMDEADLNELLQQAGFDSVEGVEAAVREHLRRQAGATPLDPATPGRGGRDAEGLHARGRSGTPPAASSGSRANRPSAPEAASSDLYWSKPVTRPIGPEEMLAREQNRPQWIYERRLEDEKRRMQQEEEELKSCGFRARPVPATLLAPRPWQVVPAYQQGGGAAAARRSRSADGADTAAGRSRSAEGRRIFDDGGEGTPAFDRPSLAERGARPGSAAAVPSAQHRRSSSLLPGEGGVAAPPRARPAPWSCTAPLYDQMLLEKDRQRVQRADQRSWRLMRAASLPPRLEAVRAHITGEAPGRGRVHRSSTPVPASQLARGAASQRRLLNRAHQAERRPEAAPRAALGAGAGAIAEAAEGLARVASASMLSGGDTSSAMVPRVLGQSVLGRGSPSSFSAWEGLAAPAGMTGVYGCSYGLSHFAPPERPATGGRAGPDPPPDHRASGSQPPGTKEVRDYAALFAALHEREQRMLERRKSRNRQSWLTQHKPFCFHTPRLLRSQVRQPKLAKDPAQDWRFRRPRSAGATPIGGAAAPVWERLPATAPPRSTEKTTQWQRHTRRMLQEREERRLREQEDELAAKQVDNEMRHRVKEAVGPVETLEEKICRIVADKKQDSALLQRKKQNDLEQIQRRVLHRPLLMEQADSVQRARRRALGRVRAALVSAGVRDVDSHFQDVELDELERGLLMPGAFLS